MKLSFDYPSWEKQSVGLTKDEADNPYLVLDEFFDYAHLPQRRDLLWNWFESTVTGNFPKELERQERNRIVAMYEHVQKLIEAAHILHVLHSSKKPKKAKKNKKS